jgi:hypothetical protein
MHIPCLLLLSTAALLSSSASASLPICTPSSQGCFDDTKGPRAVGISVPSDPASTSASSCSLLCALYGYSLAGLTSHLTPSPASFCYCGSSIAAGAAPAPAASCSQPCSGNASQTCGANNLLQLFNFSCSGPLPPAPVGPALGNGTACSQPEVQGLPFCNASLSFEERASDLVGRIALVEIGPQLTARAAPAIPRLGIPPFYFGTNAVHGITNAPFGGELCVPSTGRCVTIWPSGPNLGASFNGSMFRVMGATTGIEARALGNIQWGPTARPGQGLDFGTLWG